MHDVPERFELPVARMVAGALVGLPVCDVTEVLQDERDVGQQAVDPATSGDVVLPQRRRVEIGEDRLQGTLTLALLREHAVVDHGDELRGVLQPHAARAGAELGGGGHAFPRGEVHGRAQALAAHPTRRLDDRADRSGDRHRPATCPVLLAEGIDDDGKGTLQTSRPGGTSTTNGSDTE